MRKRRYLPWLLCAALVAAPAQPARAALLSNEVYLPLAGHPVALDRVNFVAQLAPGAQAVSRKTGIPVAVLLAQAARESGWGWTRLAMAATNVFSVKAWGPPEAAEPDEWWPGYELVGQPEWDHNNHYRIYRSVSEAIRYQGEFLTKERYQTALQNYRHHVANGMPVAQACYLYARDLRIAGYAEDPDYEDAIRRIMNNYVTPSDSVSPQFNLYQYNLESGGTFPLNTTAATLVNGTVRQGDSDQFMNGSVAQLQRLLGLYADGIAGQAVHRAVTEFQAREGLGADGVAGPQTWLRLMHAPAPYFPVLRDGDTDHSRRAMVSLAQRLLGVAPDGVFGPATGRALAAYQARLGITAEPGHVGRVTWSTLLGGGLPADRTAPRVAWTGLTGSVAAAVTPLAAEAADDLGVARVEFWAGDRLVRAVTAPPYRAEWDTAGLQDGTRVTLTVRAYDQTGNVGSATRTVTVSHSDRRPPGVSLRLPGDTRRVGGITPIYVEARDDGAVRQVDCFANGVAAGRAVHEPKKSPAYRCEWDTRTYPHGARVTLTARALDLAWNAGYSAPVTVTVQNRAAGRPAVRVTAPAAGALVSGAVPITVAAGSSLFVSKVEIYVDGWRAQVLDRPPYQYTWRTASLVNREYSIWARAYDALGNVAASAPIKVRLANPDRVAPSAALLFPAPGATVSGTVRLQAGAADYQGVARVEFWAGGDRLKTLTGAPWEMDWNTRAVPDGHHSLAVKAYDAAGNEGLSAVVPVQVNNRRPLPVRLVQPGAGGTLEGAVTLEAAVPEDAGVEQVLFYVDGKYIGDAHHHPWRLVWDTAGVSNGRRTVEARAVARGGTVASSGRWAVNVVNPERDGAWTLLVIPDSGARVRGGVTLAAPSRNPNGVARVDFYVGSYRLRSVTRAPYLARWDTTHAPDGRHSLRAVGYDPFGNILESNTVTVTVANREPGR